MFEYMLALFLFGLWIRARKGYWKLGKEVEKLREAKILFLSCVPCGTYKIEKLFYEGRGAFGSGGIADPRVGMMLVKHVDDESRLLVEFNRTMCTTATDLYAGIQIEVYEEKGQKYFRHTVVFKLVN